MASHDTIFQPTRPIASHPKTAYSKSCLVITCSLSSIAVLDRFLFNLKSAWKIQSEDFDSIRIVLSEALQNAIDHGKKSKNNLQICVDAFRDDDFYIFSVEDEGDGFDADDIENPIANENLRKPHGRGIFIMKHLADSVHFSKNGRCVKLLFRIR